MRVSQLNFKVKSPQPFAAPARLEDWNRMNTTFQALTGYYAENNSETSGVLPEKLTQAYVAPRFLQVWGIAPELGRDFTPEEEHFGGAGRGAHQQTASGGAALPAARTLSARNYESMAILFLLSG